MGKDWRLIHGNPRAPPLRRLLQVLLQYTKCETFFCHLCDFLDRSLLHTLHINYTDDRIPLLLDD